MSAEVDVLRRAARPVDASRAMRLIGEAVRASAADTRRVMRQIQRTFMSPGDRYLDKVMRDCTRRRLTAPDMAIAILVAADVAWQLDGGIGVAQ